MPIKKRNRLFPTKQTTLNRLPAAPLRHNGSIAASGAARMCGKGSHTVPSCRNPGSMLSNSPRGLIHVSNSIDMYERLVAIKKVKKCVDNDNGRNRGDRRVAHDHDSNVAAVREAVNEEAREIGN